MSTVDTTIMNHYKIVQSKCTTTVCDTCCPGQQLEGDTVPCILLVSAHMVAAHKLLCNCPANAVPVSNPAATQPAAQMVQPAL